ncbi:MFS transporter [Cellulomonas sp. H30R-01]|uniref:MFS transporter n=1 Tax=Cellulomonas sp. H30R-01 TaxID=2704467 RepID=UPI00138DAD1B|nr:MFS transporter [Cellulomonas sp. H30R-01]QHT57086.1 MFS transporter [Cellulomonas sp. H30R-01]
MTSRAARAGIGLLTAATFMLFLDVTVVNVALDRIGTELGGGLGALQWVLDAYTVALTVGLVGAGPLVDRFGPVPVAVVGVVVFTAASAACALAPTAGALLAGRAAQGVGAAVVVPASLGLVAAVHPAGPARSHAVALWSAIGAVALAVGPLVGGVLVQAAGWRSIFWLNVPVGVVVCGGLLAVRRSAPVGPRFPSRADVVGVVVLAAALLTAAVLVVEHVPPGPLGPALAVVVLVAAVGLLLRRGRGRPHAVLPTDLVTRSEVTVLLLLGGATFAGLYAFVFLVPLSDQAAFGRSALATGVAFLPLTVALCAVGLVAGRLAERFPERLLVGGALLAMAAGTGLAVGVGLDPSSPVRPVALVLVGAGATLALTPATIALLRLAGAPRAGVVTSTSNLVRNAGGVLGVALAGWAVHAGRPGAGPVPAGPELVDRVGGALTAVAVVLAAVALAFLVACPPGLTRRVPRAEPA